MTMELPSEKAENFDIREQSVTDGYVLTHTHSDGSETTFFVQEDYDIEVVRAGKDSTVSLKRIHKDGSSRTFSVATEFYEEHADKLGEYIDDPEHEPADSEDVDPLAAFEEPGDIEEGMELTDGSGDVYLLSEIDGGDTKVQVWNDGRLKRTELMPTASLRTEYKNGELELV